MKLDMEQDSVGMEQEACWIEPGIEIEFGVMDEEIQLTELEMMPEEVNQVVELK